MRHALGMRGRNRWSVAIEAGLWLGAACLLLAQIGCFAPSGFQLTHVKPGVNDKLRQDLGPSDQIGAPLRFFSEGVGMPNEGRLISTFGFSSVSPEYLGSLRLSETFWLESNAGPKLSYEAVVRYGEAVDIDEKRDVYKAYDLGSCLTKKRDDGTPEILVHDFRTRGKARVIGPDGSEIAENVGVSSIWVSDTLRLLRFTGGPAKDDPKNPPDALTTTEDTESIPEVLPSPACLSQHGLTIDRDTSYRLRFTIGSPVVLDCSELNSPESCSHRLFPTVKLINGSRRLARPLAREGQTRVWTWGVEAPTASLWKENFSPHLRVDTVAIFTEDPGAPNGRRYWTSEEVEVVLDRDALTSISCSDSITVEENGVQIPKLLVAECYPGAVGFTPTYQRSQLGSPIDDKQALLWKVKAQGQDGQPPPWGDARLYIEFDVAQSCYPDPMGCPGLMKGALLGTPEARDLGNARTGQRTTFERVFRVDSVGSGSVRVERARVEGPSASEFTVRAASGRAFPMVLPFGASLELSLDTNVQTVGDKRVEVVVEFNALGGAPPELIRLVVLARGVAPDIMVLPPIVRFEQTDASPASSSGSFGGFIIINNGSLAAQRQQIRITGPQAAYFVPLRSKYYPAVHVPPAAAQTLGPGGSEEVWLAYRPQTVGDHAATVEIQTDAGTYAIELRGTCSGTCRYEVPAVMNTPDIGVLVLGDARRGGLAGDLKVAVDRLTPGLAGTLVSLQGTDQVPGGAATLCRCLEDVELNRELVSAEAWQRLETLGIFLKEQAQLSGGRLQFCYRLTSLGERVVGALKATSSFRAR